MKRIKGHYEFKVLNITQNEKIKMNFPKGSILLGSSFPFHYPEKTSTISEIHLAKLFVLIPIIDDEEDE